ncbi:hypothetical protein ABZP36_006793 [Zizania latifolia]
MANYDHGTNLMDDDEYDDLDDFIVDNDDGMMSGEEQQECELDELEGEEDEEEEEEAPVGQVEILTLREQLKADIRRKKQAQQGAFAGMARCSSAMQAPVKDRFGIFFGPSGQTFTFSLSHRRRLFINNERNTELAIQENLCFLVFESTTNRKRAAAETEVC